MKSETITVEHLFKDRRQYLVPFFQRAYVWSRAEQWEQLWEDIQDKAEARISGRKPSPHFLGAVVLDPQAREGLLGVDVFHIIDGQQRLSTLQFVISAIALALRRHELLPLLSVVSACLRNGNPETMRDKDVEVYKVWPTFRDREHFKRAMGAQVPDDLEAQFPAHFTGKGNLRKIGVDHPPALEATWYFAEQAESWIGTDKDQQAKRAEALISAVFSDMKLVCIVLEREDDAQIIFETLNGRGAQLHATDLIRNYLFMRADRAGENAAELYDKFWSPFEATYWSEEQRRGRLKKPRIEWFIHATLQSQLHEEVDLGRLYHEYRRFAVGGSDALSAEKQLLTLSEYADHYKALVSGSGSSPIALFGRRIAHYDITTLYSLVLMIAATKTSVSEQQQMYSDLVSYVVRRSVCGLTTKNYNQVFLSTLKRLSEGGVNAASLRSALGGLQGETTRWPTDAEFKNACLNNSLYPGTMETPRIRSMLTELEGQLRRGARIEEPVPPNLESLDVDHILPRSWMSYWKLPDGSTATTAEVADVDLLLVLNDELNDRQTMIAQRQKAICRLGNLTLLNLSVNREAQNFDFGRKVELLISDTGLRLNIPQIALPGWDEQRINARGEILADAALKLWPGPPPQPKD